MRARSLLAVLCVVALVSAWVRVANNLRRAEADDAGGRAAWFATDPDSLYHMRRLERALDSGGWIDPRDPLLDHPTADGAPIPWPPTYTRVLWAASAPFAPDDAELRRAFVERTTATAPAVISVLTSVLVALAAARLAGVGAGLIAGLLHAVNFASMRYSHLGIGDHHAWISLLHVAWLAAAAEGLRALDRPRLALRWGALAGLFAGAGLTSWVAALLLVVLFQFALVLRLWMTRRDLPEGLVPFTAGFHGVALLLTLAEALCSPWPAFDLLNLSYVHVWLLLLGLVGALLVGARPAITASAFGIGAAALIVLAWLPVVPGLMGALDWLSARDPFMAHIAESQPLGEAALRWCGFGLVLLPVAWIAAWRPRDRTLLPALEPWLIAVPVLVATAFLQRRFAEGLAAPAALVLAVGTLRLAPKAGTGRAVCAGGLSLLALASSPSVWRTTWNRTTHGVWWVETSIASQERSLRSACRWLRQQAAGGAVLAQWDLGHLIEWQAGWPTLATNFGSYLGPRWVDPWRVLAAQDEAQVAPILAEREVRYVLVAADWRRNRAPMGEFGEVDTSLAARLVPRGVPGRDPALADLGTLRLVHLGSSGSLDASASGSPRCWVYERVLGAELVARGEPGESLRVSLEFRIDARPFEWVATALVGEDGRARLRVPHPGQARWRRGTLTGGVSISADDVSSGATLTLP